MTRLHEAQIDVPDALARSLVDHQFPQWSSLPLVRANSDGTINRVDFLGDDLVVRMPFIDWGADDTERHATLPPALRDALGVEVPELVARGAPAPGMPWEWGVYRRIAGRHPVACDATDEAAVLAGITDLLLALRSVPTDGVAPSPAAFDAAADDAATRPKVAALGSRAAARAWDEAVQASESRSARAASAPAPSWIHGDVMPGNLLLLDDSTRGPRLHAVLDWAAAGSGDPTLDLLGAWTCLGPSARRALFEAVRATPLDIAVARGFAVRKVAWGLPYYRETLPGFAAVLAFTLEQLEADD